MRWWVCAVLFAVELQAATPQKLIATAPVNSELRASLTSEYTLDITVTPHAGDAWTRLAKRVTGDAANWRTIAAINGDKLTSEAPVHVPFALLRPELQRQIITTLFPKDSATPDGWKHIATGPAGAESESLWSIAEWFTGAGENYTAIRSANPNQPLSTHPGDVIFIPKHLLSAAFGGEREDVNASSKTAEVRKSEDDPVERASADAPAANLAVETVAAGQPSLSYVRHAPEPYAVYRLQKGEALYSSVAIRFTGRVYSKDVGDVVDRIVKFNAIDDVAKIPVGYAVRIPFSLLLPQYLPADDPRRLAAEMIERESAKLAKRTRAKGLHGVHIILDAGHGGTDPGAIYEDVSESTYVYDVMNRLEEILSKKSAARVTVTRDEKNVLTTPAFTLDDPVVGVHLRWYLANSIFRHAIKRGVPKEKVVFISIHADSLHPSLRGAMAYIPAERYVTGSYRKTEQVYLARAEVREHPVVRHSEEESLEAEGLSRDLAQSIIDAFDSKDLKVHPFNAVRDSVVRDGREWVPAIIRYNMVPTRLLLEICNLGNVEDRALIKTKRYRQDVASAIYEGLVDFFADREEAPSRVATK
ncbi:MAG TPA: N-acetylmuramoyl-L-alanine amidase [Thermoanaerobaculia bacterium]|nr:N-acetylmuramoyl-L-alanine amidase [Thermoanaerobaculia bacterium]